MKQTLQEAGSQPAGNAAFQKEDPTLGSSSQELPVDGGWSKSSRAEATATQLLKGHGLLEVFWVLKGQLPFTHAAESSGEHLAISQKHGPHRPGPLMNLLPFCHRVSPPETDDWEALVLAS